MKTKITAIILIIVLTLSLALSGCSEDAVRNLSDDYSSLSIIETSNISQSSKDYTEFASKLFEKCFDGEGNTLVSPLSIALAFAMVAEGADTETLAEIESVFGMDINEIRQFAYSYMYPKAVNNQLTASNSLWVNAAESFKVKDDFLQINADYHKADVFMTKFSRKTVEEINNWVKKNTEGMIDKIVDNLDKRSVMCLVNALLFDAKWEEEYKEHQVNDGVFTTEKGEINPVKYLDGPENLYIKDENAKGFVKYYDGRDYAFVALLPDADVSVQDYVKTLNGKKFDELLKNVEETKVITRIPKFEYETKLNLNSVLKDMGMEKAFDKEKADFSRLGQILGGNIWVGDVMHSTKITVAEQGTKAGAATAVIKYGAGASPVQEEPKEVYLERPFVYMIIDMENNLPVFMGTVMSVGE